ncbi:MAG: hypothetical protein IKW85_12180 [Muribaculaceae bacterium]|nr:hypothetical protein [Muribaculaceae bacterium]
MKKYLIIATAALIALPLFNACNKPTGDPEKDARNKKQIIDQNQELEIEFLEKKLEVAEYYAEKGDYKEYKRFLKNLDLIKEKVERKLQREHDDEYHDIVGRRHKAEKAFSKDSNSPRYNNYGGY